MKISRSGHVTSLFPSPDSVVQMEISGENWCLSVGRLGHIYAMRQWGNEMYKCLLRN